MIVLPCWGKLLLQNRTKINRIMKKELHPPPMQSFKDKICVFLRPDIVNKFKCSGCNATYCGKI